MQYLDILIVGLIVLGAAYYLHRIFFAKKKDSSSCGCGTADCKVPKAKIKGHNLAPRESDKSVASTELKNQ